jgi:hypothetical protein
MKLITFLIQKVSVYLPGIVKDFLDIVFQVFFVLIVITIATYFNIKTYFTYFIAFSLYWIIKSFIYKESKLSINNLIKILSLIILIVLIITVGLYLFDIQILETIYCEGGDNLEEATEKATEKAKSEPNTEGGNLTTEPKERIKEPENSFIQEVKNIVDKTTKTADNVSEAVKVTSENLVKAMDKLEKVTNTVVETIGKVAVDHAPELLAIAAGGRVASKVVVPLLEKGMGPMIAGTGAVAGVVTGSTYGVIKAIQSTETNKNVQSSSSQDSTKNPEPDSPSDISGGGFIQSPNEIEIPLFGLLDSLLIFNCLELSLMITMFLVLFRLIINPKLKFLILKLLSYIVKNKIEFSNKEVKINSIFNASAKYSNYAIALMLITLILLKCINLYFLVYLSENIDSFIIVYNILKKK